MGEEMHPPLHQEGEKNVVRGNRQHGMEWKRKEISQWCKNNKVYDVITEEEIAELWKRECPDDEDIRHNGKYVWETAKRVCDFINTRGLHQHHDIRRIPSCDEEGDDGN